MTASIPLSPKAVSQRFFRRRPEDHLPLTVQHQRIYIVPSRRGLAFLIALLVCLVASINYQLNIGYGLSFLLTGLFSASLLHTYKNLSGLTLTTLHANPVVCADMATFVLQLSNNRHQDRIGIDIKYAGQCVRTDVLGNESTRVKLPLQTTHRGHQPLGRIALTSQYPIGLWTTWSYCHTPATVLVYPKPERNPPPLPRAATSGDADSIRAGVEGDVASLRDYVPGDPLTRVAWKRVANGGGLHVRELEETLPSGDIELNVAATDVYKTEEQVSRLAAWVDQASQLGAEYSLTLDSLRLEPASGDAHRHACLEALAIYRLPAGHTRAPQASKP